MNTASLLAAALAALALSAAAVRPLGRLAWRLGMIDRPTGGHKRHPRPVPYLGGVALALGALVPLPLVAGLPERRIAAVVCGALIVGLVGLIDDARPLSPVTKLAVQGAAATGVVLNGVSVPLTGGWADGPVTLLWVVLLTNSFNFLDNMDGALASVLTVSAALLAAAAFATGRPGPGLLLTALCYACLGFLLHNWPPAKIFLGDCGSLFAGFLFSCSAVLLTDGQPPVAALGGLLLPTFVATVDTVMVVWHRARIGQSQLQGGHDHLSHRLRAAGFGERQVALALAGTAAIAGTAHFAMVTGRLSPPVTTAAGIGVAAVLVVLARRLRAPDPDLSHTPTFDISERR
ncbi:hypothetical protein Sru01_36920 [Sphaerisporangium rufum]|uniref:Undecaprenyl/decaprenyl-phosphate alpha-N-acetylglucosaminyl 1-phosphate transferase n=1 Tax=Sphaerisporangium rufum TaxID=1381558 RepID=A0A919R7K2_9ACTN|nr:MraY family glycosyltransferase [Sphaerisporangium rufum]GII78710.1 hypothetical protein Sru01_36920 [Sphaerisporangium rufum]